MTENRRARVERTTKESDIVVELDLDGTGNVDVDTGVPFYDHMLTSLGSHASFDLTVRTKGDAIDFHEIDAFLEHVRRNQPANLGGVCARVQRTESACEPLGLRRYESVLLGVVVAGNRIGRRQHHVHRLVEPAIDARPNQLTANQQHEQRRHNSHPE